MQNVVFDVFIWIASSSCLVLAMPVKGKGQEIDIDFYQKHSLISIQ
jgi:hypothetical protein